MLIRLSFFYAWESVQRFCLLKKKKKSTNFHSAFILIVNREEFHARSRNKVSNVSQYDNLFWNAFKHRDWKEVSCFWKKCVMCTECYKYRIECVIPCRRHDRFSQYNVNRNLDETSRYPNFSLDLLFPLFLPPVRHNSPYNFSAYASGYLFSVCVRAACCSRLAKCYLTFCSPSTNLVGLEEFWRCAQACKLNRR